jgi:diacylglycerol O-acyltransferase / wax synthase
MATLDRLSPQDASNLRVEARGSAMHLAGLALLDGAALLDRDGRLRLEHLREHVEARLHLSHRLRQVLHRPDVGMGPPVWVDDRRFDIARHVRTRSVPGPGDEPALLATVAELNAPPLDRSRPLWELWFLTGLASGRVALLIRLHHVVADGIAAIALLGALFDFEAEAPSPVPPAWEPQPIPSSRELRSDALQRRAAPLAAGASWLRRPERWWGQATTAAGPLVQTLRDGPAPRSFLNGKIGASRRLHLARADLERTRTVAHAHGATINDVVLAAVAGGARALVARREGLSRGAELRAMVPVSRRTSADESGGGNLLAIMIVPLPIGEPDPGRRLERIASATAERKRRPIEPWARFPSLLAAGMHHQRLVNVFTSNVPGPIAPWYFAGARVFELFQIGPVQGNVRLNVGALSYAGTLYLDTVADAESIPDADVFAAGLQQTLDVMGTTAVP